jgi:hypothetical protein
MAHGVGWTYVTADQIVNQGETLLHSIILLTSAAGTGVTLYDGLDAVSGRSLGPFEGAANISFSHTFPKPLRLDRGLFVDIGTNVTGVLVVWEPLKDEKLPDH